MNHECSCKSEKSTKPHLVSVSAAQLEQLAGLSSQRLFAVSKPAEATAKGKVGLLYTGSGLQTYFHITSDGDSLATTSFVEGLTVDTVVCGVIAGISYELHIRVAFEGEQIAVTLHLTKPIEIGPYPFRFDLGGIVKDDRGKIVSVSTITPAADFQTMGINWWCAVRCGGATILPTLISCVPAFIAGGPVGYVACVTGKLGSVDAAAIAVCIAKECM